MDKQQAKQMLKQVDCHGIPRGYNGGYSELYKYCLGCIEKLDKIEQIIKAYDGSAVSMIKQFSEIQRILEQE